VIVDDEDEETLAAIEVYEKQKPGDRACTILTKWTTASSTR